MGQQYCYHHHHHHHHHHHLTIIIISIPSSSLLTLGPDFAVTFMHLCLNSVRTQCGFTQKVDTKRSEQTICLV